MKDAYAVKFFVLTSLITWSAWGFLILNGKALDPSSPTYRLFVLGGFGPSLSALVMTALSNGRSGLRDLWQRTMRIGFGVQWHLVIFLLFPLVNAVTLLVISLFGNSTPDLSLIASLLRSPSLILPVLISFFIFGALAEEFGWRGYALDRLQDSLGPAIGSLFLGVLWAVWHMPMFFIAGLPQHDSGLSFLLFPLWIIALSPIYTWIYNGTGRSLAAMLLLHWVSTTVGSLLPTSQSETIILVLISAAIVAVWLKRSKRLVESHERA